MFFRVIHGDTWLCPSCEEPMTLVSPFDLGKGFGVIGCTNRDCDMLDRKFAVPVLAVEFKEILQ